MVIQVYAPTSNAEEAEVEHYYEDLQNLLKLTPKKGCFFHYRGLEETELESRLLGEISITSDMQMTPPLWKKVKRN